MGSLQHFLPGAQPLCLRGRIQDAVSPPWFLLKEAMSDDRTVGPSASEVVVNWGRSTRHESHMQRCAPEMEGNKPGRVVSASNSSAWEAEAGGSEALGLPGLHSKTERDGKCWLGALQI